MSGNDAFETENFSEISLDRDSNLDAPILQADNNNIYNPLADLDSGFDQPAILSGAHQENFNQNVDANLNPLSAALAQLPNAASTVFSTFSNIIKGSTPVQQSGTTTVASEDQYSQENHFVPNYGSGFDQNYNQPTGYQYAAEPPLLNPPPAPTFFSPSDTNLFKKQETEAGNHPTNTFRLGGNKKKQYAHIPGLNRSQQQASLPDPLPQQNFGFSGVQQETSIPPVVQNIPPLPANQQFHQASFGLGSVQQPVYEPPKPQETVKPNKFSFTSLIPTQILEKLPVPGFSEKKEEKPTPANYFADQSFGVSTQSEQPPLQTQQLVQQFPPAPVPDLIQPQLFNTTPFNKPPIVPAATEIQQSTESQPQINPVEPAPPSIGPPPTFYNPANPDLFKKKPEEGASKNPYSSRLSRGSGLYKNHLIQTSNTGPILIPAATSSAVPTPANLFNPPQAVNPVQQNQLPATPFAPPIIQKQQQPPVNFFNPNNNWQGQLTNPGNPTSFYPDQKFSAADQADFNKLPPLPPKSITPVQQTGKKFTNFIIIEI